MKYYTRGELLAAFVSLVVLAAVIVFTGKAQAGEAYMQVSVGQTMWRGEAPIGDIEFVLPANIASHLYSDFGVTVLDQTSYNGQHIDPNSILRAGVLWRDYHLALGAGVAYINNPSPFIGQRENFALTAGYEFGRVTLQYLHFSDMSQREPNVGRDILEIGWRF